MTLYKHIVDILLYSPLYSEVIGEDLIVMEIVYVTRDTCSFVYIYIGGDELRENQLSGLQDMLDGVN